MNSKKRLFASALLIALAGAGVLISGSQNVAKAGPGATPVSIMSPLPLPVTGTATVSGTVGAAQSGAWNVNVANSPAVSLAGTPTVNANVTFPANQGVTVTAPGPLTHLGRLPSKQVMLLLAPVGAPACASHTAQINIDGTTSCFDMANHPGEALVITDLLYTASNPTTGNTCTANVGSLSNNQTVLPLQATAAADGNAMKSEHLIAGLTMTFTPVLLTVNGNCFTNAVYAQGYLLSNQ